MTLLTPHAVRRNLEYQLNPSDLSVVGLSVKGGGHTCRTKEPKTIEAIIESAATQLLI